MTHKASLDMNYNVEMMHRASLFQNHNQHPQIIFKCFVCQMCQRTASGAYDQVKGTSARLLQLSQTKVESVDIQVMKQAINNAISKHVGQVSKKTSIIHFYLNTKNRSKKRAQTGLHHSHHNTLSFRLQEKQNAIEDLCYPYGFYSKFQLSRLHGDFLLHKLVLKPACDYHSSSTVYFHI